jgi:carbamate kinase
MRIVAALGGNVLIRRGQPMSVQVQRDNLVAAARSLAPLAGENELVVTHGNGPQVGWLALQAAAWQDSRADAETTPLDVLGAESDGMVGYLVEQALACELRGHPIATLLTQVRVDVADPAFAAPTKPVGPGYRLEEVQLLAERGWQFAPDGDQWRRVVPSPRPQQIIELPAIRHLLHAGVVVVCAGGGGIPVVERDGLLRGIDAVIDKDAASALLARELQADVLLLLTDVDGIRIDFGSPVEHRLASATPNSLRKLTLPAGSIGAKALAAAEFVSTTGRRAAIGRLGDVAVLLAGTAGTQVTRDESDLS